LGTGVEPEFRPWAGRTLDVSFVGTVDAALNPARAALLEGLKARGQAVHVAQGDFRPVYPDSRIVINQSVNDDLNLRCFEAMAKGALLITDRISHSLGDIGTPGTDFLVYAPGNADDLLAHIRWALAHPGEAEAIARRGHARAVSSHLLGHRVDALIGALPAAGMHGPDAKALAHLAAAQEHLSRLALPAHLTAFFAAEARRSAEAALDASPDEPFALLALAQLEFESGTYGAALARLDRGEGLDGGGEYRLRYATLKSLALAHAGLIQEARRTVSAGLGEFPLDEGLRAIAKALGLPEAAA
jgi:hypothetical protein